MAIWLVNCSKPLPGLSKSKLAREVPSEAGVQADGAAFEIEGESSAEVTRRKMQVSGQRSALDLQAFRQGERVA